MLKGQVERLDDTIANLKTTLNTDLISELNDEISIINMQKQTLDNTNEFQRELEEWTANPAPSNNNDSIIIDQYQHQNTLNTDTYGTGAMDSDSVTAEFR